MTDTQAVNDPFEVELERVVRRLRALSPGDEAGQRSSWRSSLGSLVQRLGDAHADAAGIERREVPGAGGADVAPALLAEMLRAVPFDAAQVTDIHGFAAELAAVRRSL